MLHYVYADIGYIIVHAHSPILTLRCFFLFKDKKKKTFNLFKIFQNTVKTNVKFVYKHTRTHAIFILNINIINYIYLIKTTIKAVIVCNII